MAYKQAPRGNFAKTGHGLPAPFRQEDLGKFKEKTKKVDTKEKEMMGKTTTPSMTQTAVDLLEGTSQQKNLMKDVKKDVSGKITSYKAEPNSFKATEQLQIAGDSLNYISGAKDEIGRMKLGKDFHNTYSTNNPKNKGDYKGPGGASGTAKAKEETFNKLMGANATTRGFDTFRKTFETPKPAENKITGKVKKR